MNLFYIICIAHFIFTSTFRPTAADEHQLTLKDNVPLTTEINCGFKYELHIQNNALFLQYVLFQAHSQWDALIISETNQTMYGHYRKGNGVGLIQMIPEIGSDPHCFLWCADHRKGEVKVLLFAQMQSTEAPIPGGCNMEFPLKNDPNILIDTSIETHIHKVEFQYANAGSDTVGHTVSCEGKGQERRKKLSYTLYESTLEDLSVNEDHLFKQLKTILKSDKENGVYGHKVDHMIYNATTELDFRTYKRQGVIYTVLVEDHSKPGNPHALYVPVHYYGCESREDCTKYSLASIASLVALTAVGLLSIFIAFFGHRFFKTEMFLFGHVALMLALLLVLVRFSSFQFNISVITAASLAIFGGLAWLALWYFKGNPLVAIIMPSLVLGFLFSTILFCFTPFGDLHIFASPVSYGLAFACFILVLPVSFLYFTKLLNILCCAFVGTFLVMWVISLNLAGSFKHIIQDMLYSLTSTRYLLAEDYLPFTDNDIILCVIWIAMFATALGFQLSREKGRPPFPPCPYELRKRAQERADREMRDPPAINAQIENANGFHNETDPLLARGRGGHSSSSSPAGRHDTKYGSGRSSLSREDNNAIIDPAL